MWLSLLKPEADGLPAQMSCLTPHMLMVSEKLLNFPLCSSAETKDRFWEMH